MGKGDKRTKRGKIVRGSYGNSRPKVRKSSFVAAEEKPKPKKKAAPKKRATRKKKS